MEVLWRRQRGGGGGSLATWRQLRQLGRGCSSAAAVVAAAVEAVRQRDGSDGSLAAAAMRRRWRWQPHDNQTLKGLPPLWR